LSVRFEISCRDSCCRPNWSISTFSCFWSEIIIHVVVSIRRIGAIGIVPVGIGSVVVGIGIVTVSIGGVAVGIGVTAGTNIGVSIAIPTIIAAVVCASAAIVGATVAVVGASVAVVGASVAVVGASAAVFGASAAVAWTETIFIDRCDVVLRAGIAPVRKYTDTGSVLVANTAVGAYSAAV
jgi:hypothetical protein